MPLKNWDNSVDQYIIRVNRVAESFPELSLPVIGNAEKVLIIEEICAGAFSYKEIKDRPVGSCKQTAWSCYLQRR